MDQSTILLSTLASQVASGGKLTLDTSDSAMVSTASNVSVLRNGNSFLSASPMGTLQWAAYINGVDQSYALPRIATDNEQSVLVCGAYRAVYNGTSVINVSGTIATTLRPTGDTAAFVVKYSASGFYQWARIIDSSGTNIHTTQSVTTDVSGNVYFAGDYPAVTVSLYDGSGNFIRNLRNHPTRNTGYVIKLTKDGVFEWCVTFESGNNVFTRDVCTDPNGNVYVSGWMFQSTTLYLHTGTSLATINTSLSQSMPYVVKLTASGGYLWHSHLDSYRFQSIATDGFGNLYTVGTYNLSGTRIYNSAGSTMGVLRSSPLTPNTQSFVIKYSASGTLLWNNTVEASGYAQLAHIASDSSGNLCVNGAYDGGATIYSSSETIVGTLRIPSSAAASIIRYNASGVLAWTTTIDSPGGDSGGGVSILNGVVYATGFYNTSGSIYNTSGIIVAALPQTINVGGNNSYIVAINSSGVLTMINAVRGGSGLDVVANGPRLYVCGTGSQNMINSSGVSTPLAPFTISRLDILALQSTDLQVTSTSPYTLPSLIQNTNNGFQKVLYHAPNSNATTATVNVTNPSGSTLSTYTIGQGSNVSLLWLDNQWVQGRWI